MLQFLGLHLHSDDISGINHAHDDHEEGPPDYIYKMLVVIGGIYSFYLMETIFSLISSSHEHHHHEVSKTLVLLLIHWCPEVQTAMSSPGLSSPSGPVGGIRAASLRPRKGAGNVSAGKEERSHTIHVRTGEKREAG